MKRLVLSLFLLGSASAAELRIYPSFGEVREPVTLSGSVYTFSLPPNAWAQVVPGTLDLEGVNILARELQLQQGWLKSLEGKGVTLLEDGHTERVTLVRASDLLIRDPAGHYRNVRFEQLAFDSLPPENAQAPAQSVSFQLAGGGDATLSYLTRAVSWSPRYTLRLSGSAGSLSALADIRNAGETPYEVVTGELIAGDVSLNEPVIVPDRSVAGPEAARALMDVPAPKIVPAGESRGLYRYTLAQPFRLDPNSTLSLPFLMPKVTFERYAGLTTGFANNATEGKLNRDYRVKSDVLLPAGPITVRDEGRIVGQTSIDDTSPGDPIELVLGSDPDVSYKRAVQVLRQDKTGATYRVTLTLQNDKDRPLRAEVRENFGGNVTVEGQAERTPQGLLVRADLPAHGKVTRTYTVTFKYGG